MIKIILLILIIITSFEAKSQWILQSQPTGFDIFSCSFLDENNGYICGYGNSLFKTTNGGQSWIDLSFPTTANNLNAIYFFNVNSGFVCSTNDSLYRTTNGGQNWTPVNIGFQAQTVSFPDANTGYVSGFGGIARTTDAGNTWTSWNIQGYGDIFFVNALTGWTSYYFGGGSNLNKTTDGGISWNTQYTTSDFRVIYNFSFINENTGWACGYREFILKTTNGGTNWTLQHDEEGMPGIYSINFLNSNTGWAAGDFYFSGGSKVFFTTDGGDVWQSFFLSTNAGRLSQVQFVNQNTGFITGQYGRVFKTTDRGGLTSVSGIGNTTPDNYKLMQNYPNPFNPTTKIKFDIAAARFNKGGQGRFVSLKVYDITGKEIQTLVNNNLSFGTYEVTFDGSNFASGIYFYKLQAGDFIETRKMIILK